MISQKSPNNFSEILYMRHGETLSAYLQNKVLPALNSGAGSLDSEKLLEEFVKRWSNHMLMNNWYRKFFRRLVSNFFSKSTKPLLIKTLQDRYHVKYYHLPTLEKAGLGLFKTIVFDAVKNNLANAVIEAIGRERAGMSRKCIYTNFLSNCLFTSFHYLGFNQHQSRFNRNRSPYIHT